MESLEERRMKKVLFVCVGNSCRSQMAQGFFNAFATDAIASSAGTQPANHIASKTIAVMKESGVDISGMSCNATGKNN